MAQYEVIAQRAAVFDSPNALYSREDPYNAIVSYLAQGDRFAGRSTWRSVFVLGHKVKIQWIYRIDEGGYVLPDCVRRVRDTEQSH